MRTTVCQPAPRLLSKDLGLSDMFRNYRLPYCRITFEKVVEIDELRQKCVWDYDTSRTITILITFKTTSIKRAKLLDKSQIAQRHEWHILQCKSINDHESKRHERVRFYRQNAFQGHLLTLLYLIFIIDIYFYYCFMCLYGCGLSTFIKLLLLLIWSHSINYKNYKTTEDVVVPMQP